MNTMNDQAASEPEEVTVHIRPSFRTPSKYKFAFCIFAIVVTIPSLLFAWFGLPGHRPPQLVFFAGLVATVWILFAGLHANMQWAFWVSFIGSFAVWALLLVQTLRRTWVQEYGGMKSSDGYGPMPFLIRIIMEQWFFIPLCFVVLCGALSLVSGLRRSV